MAGIDRHQDDLDDGDGFGNSIRKAQKINTVTLHRSRSIRSYVSIAVSVLTAGPMLQMQWQEPPGDPQWVEILSELDDERFLVLAPALWAGIADRECSFGLGGLDRIIDDIGSRLGDEQFSHNADVHHSVVSLLDSTMHLWLASSASQGSAGAKVRQLLTWLINLVYAGICDSWRVRSRFVALLDRYVAADPAQTFWSHIEDDDAEPPPRETPVDCLKRLATDRDMRVRYRGVIGTARLFQYTTTVYQASADNQGISKVTPLYLEVGLTDTAAYEQYVLLPVSEVS